MANIAILYHPSSDLGAISGGSWRARLPLANVRNNQPKHVARSTDATLASTRFVVDMGEAKPIQMLALIAHSLTRRATVRFRTADAADGTGTDIDKTIFAEPTIVWGSIPWGSFPWDGNLLDDQPGGPTTLYNHPTQSVKRFIIVDIDDTANPAGYIDIGRFMAGLPFYPRFNMNYGAQLGFVDESRQSRSVGGQDYFDLRPLRRTFSCEFDFMTQPDALGNAYDIHRHLGMTAPLLLVYDPEDDGSVLLRRTMYARLTSLAPITTVNPSQAPYSWSLNVEEIL